MITALQTSRYRVEAGQRQLSNRDVKYQQRMQLVEAGIDRRLQGNLGLDQAAEAFGCLAACLLVNFAATPV